MKTIISLLIVIASLSAGAQLVPTTSLTPGSPNISPVSPGFNNIFGPLFNQVGTNAVPANFDTGLAALQNDIQQLLPLLATFNETVDFSTIVATASATNATGSTAPVPVSGQNLSTRTSANFSTLSSSDLSTRVGGTAINGPLQTALGPGNNQTALSPTGVNNPLGLAPGFGGPITTNAFGTPITARDAVRDLIILQNDLERLLPVLVTLNGSSLPSGFTNMVGSLNTSATASGTVSLTGH